MDGWMDGWMDASPSLVPQPTRLWKVCPPPPSFLEQNLGQIFVDKCPTQRPVVQGAYSYPASTLHPTLVGWVVSLSLSLYLLLISLSLFSLPLSHLFS